MDLFLHDNGLRHERVKLSVLGHDEMLHNSLLESSNRNDLSYQGWNVTQLALTNKVIL